MNRIRKSAVALFLLGPLPVPSITYAERPQDQHLAPISDQTVRTIEAALRYLALRQRDDGGWTVGGDEHAAAITAYVIHAFLAAGHTPGDGEHAQTLERAIDFLLRCARPDGYIAFERGSSNMYGHGIATIVLAELYGMTPDPRVRPALERAVQVIRRSQNREGGWRYAPRPADADVSVTVLQLIALRVARDSGIAVPQEVIDRGIAYIRSCFNPRLGGFTYQAHGGDDIGFARTAAAVFSLQVCGIYQDPMIDAGARHVLRVGMTEKRWWTYGQFYAAPALYLRGGPDWPRWYAQVEQRLLSQVRRDGDAAYWTPIGDGGQNEIYATACYVSILSVPLAYLPAYQR